jgi:Na+/H+ antiporter NhaC
MSLLLKLIPLIVIIVLLVMRKHMLFAGLVGGILAILIGGIPIPAATGIFLGGVGNMLSITVPILYAAAAAMVSRAGSVGAIVELAKKSLKSKISLLAGVLVLIQAFATYTAGLGAGNTMVTAPLVALAVGVVPEVIAGMAIATAVGFTTSPASTETILASESAGVDVLTHAANMRPYTIIFFLLAAALAVYGVHRRGTLFREGREPETMKTTGTIQSKQTVGTDKSKSTVPPAGPVKRAETVRTADGGDRVQQTESPESNGTLLKRSIPILALLIMVVAGSALNGFIGAPVFTPATTVIITAILTVLLTPLNISETAEALIDGSRFILTTLFAVGIFLGFINMIAEMGTFADIAAIAGQVPESIILPVAMVLAFLIAIPSGAFAAGVLTLVLPTLSTLGLSSLAMGFVAIATGLGTQISPVQINVAALSKGFEIDIIDVIRGNFKYVVSALVLLILVAVVVT